MRGVLRLGNSTRCREVPRPALLVVDWFERSTRSTRTTTSHLTPPVVQVNFSGPKKKRTHPTVHGYGASSRPIAIPPSFCVLHPRPGPLLPRRVSSTVADIKSWYTFAFRLQRTQFSAIACSQSHVITPFPGSLRSSSGSSEHTLVQGGYHTHSLWFTA
jgi:hypothetical protein